MFAEEARETSSRLMSLVNVHRDDLFSPVNSFRRYDRHLLRRQTNVASARTIDGPSSNRNDRFRVAAR